MKNQELSRKEIWKMFDAISATYDKANGFMTLGMDRRWRESLSSFIPKDLPISLLDCATGTGEQLFAIVKKCPKIKEAIGIDLSTGMLAKGREKALMSNHADKIALIEGSGLAIPFPENRFDIVTLSFGIRNMEDVSLCLREIFRVLKPNGKVLILETSTPTRPILKKLHFFYMDKVLPFIGRKIAKEQGAYEYLQKTAKTFPSGKEFCTLLTESGFTNVEHFPKFFGAVSTYVGLKC